LPLVSSLGAFLLVAMSISGVTNAGVAKLIDGSFTTFAPTGTPSALSFTVTVTTPSPPRSVIGMAGPSSITLYWATSASNGGDAIERYVVTSPQSPREWTTTATHCMISNLNNRVRYNFQVIAVNSVGSSAPSAKSSALALIEPTAPHSPTMVVARRATHAWAGYAVAGNVGEFHAVSADWVVPVTKCDISTNGDFSQWVGIDGYGNSTVEQDGTEADCTKGAAVPHYLAWYEMYGVNAVDQGNAIGLPSQNYHVAGGDIFSASVRVHNHVWTFRLSDLTAGWVFNKAIALPNYQLARSTAEFVIENNAPEPVPDFANTTFMNAAITTSGAAEPISAFPNYEFSTTSNSSAIAVPSALRSGGTSFTITRQRGTSVNPF